MPSENFESFSVGTTINTSNSVFNFFQSGGGADSGSFVVTDEKSHSGSKSLIGSTASNSNAMGTVGAIDTLYRAELYFYPEALATLPGSGSSSGYCLPVLCGVLLAGSFGMGSLSVFVVGDPAGGPYGGIDSPGVWVTGSTSVSAGLPAMTQEKVANVSEFDQWYKAEVTQFMTPTKVLTSTLKLKNASGTTIINKTVVMEDETYAPYIDGPLFAFQLSKKGESANGRSWQSVYVDDYLHEVSGTPPDPEDPDGPTVSTKVLVSPGTEIDISAYSVWDGSQELPVSSVSIHPG